ncbi:MAG: ion channel [Acetobacteraceae bacterium]
MAKADRRARLEVRSGAFEVRGRRFRGFDPRDPYHGALTASWPLFLAILFCLEVGINFVFALLYLARPGSIANAAPGAFGDAFFFSIETLATVGYGAMSPATLYGHVISTLEIFCGMAFTALATGLTFVRFSRPRAKFLYADSAVVTPMNGRPTLMVRIANGRTGTLTDARVTLTVLMAEHSAEGLSFRRNYDLKLVRHRLPLLPLTWTLMHELGPASPLHGLDAAALAAADARLLLTISARDPALAAEVHDARDYPAANILFGMRYADAVVTDAQGRTLADLTLLSEVELVPTP